MILAAAIAVAGAACSSDPVSKTRALDSRLAWACDRLVVEWSVDADRAQQMVGDLLEARLIDGFGRVQLQVMRCQPSGAVRRDLQAFAYAYVLIPVTGDAAPITITRIPPDGWFSLQHAIASADSRAPFDDFDYEVVVATQDFAIEEINGDMSLTIQLTFGNGHISINANSTGSPSGQTGSTAFLGSGDGYVSAYFGEEASQRYAASATARIVGKTPLSPFELRSAPAAVMLDRRLVSQRIYWRIPTYSETGARNSPDITPQTEQVKTG